MRFLPQQRDANFVTLECKPGAMSMRFWKCGLVNCASSLIPRISKNIKILKSVKLKQQDFSSEVLVTAIEEKCNFT